MNAGTGSAERRRTQLRRPPALLLDLVLAILLTSGGLAAVTSLPHDTSVAVTVIAAIAATSTVGWRRRQPALAVVVIMTAVAVYQISGQDQQGAFMAIAVVLVCYSAGRAVNRRPLGAVALYALAASTVIVADSGFSPAKLVLAWVPMVVVPMTAGALVTRSAAMIERLRDTEARLIGEHRLAEARSVAQERHRAARDVHDVLGHHVSLMVIQAGAARLLASSDAAAARTALTVVIDSGRDALADLRRAIGVRRRADDAEPSLAQLEELIARSRRAGIDVRLRAADVGPVPDDVGLTVFRVVQEALTNVHKYAPSARATVAITRGPDAVEVLVENTGPALPAVDRAVTGHGLIGMAERVSVHGGDVLAAPTAAGGFAVRARVPLFGAAVEPAASPDDGLAPPRRSAALTRFQFDAVIAAAWLVALEIEAATSTHRSGPLWLNATLVAGLAAAGLIRRRAPLAFLAIAGAFAFALSGGIAAPQRASVVGSFTLLVGGYTVAAYCSPGRPLSGLIMLLTGASTMVVVHGAAAGVALGAGLMSCAAWTVGRITRRQREVAARLRSATAQLAAERDERAAIARFDERARIARDLHTRVASVVSAMVVQAEAARDTVGTDAERAKTMTADIEESGREALRQMRQLLGVLRDVHEPARLRPSVVPSAAAGAGALAVSR